MAENNDNGASLSINDSMLTPFQIENLFTGEEAGPGGGGDSGPQDKSGGDKKEKDAETEPVDVNSLFGSESVGSGKEEKEEDEDAAGKGAGSSPENKGFYSSIAKAFRDDGIFLDLDEEVIGDVKDANDFARLVNHEINRRSGANVKRLNDALKAGVEPDEIRKYESTLSYLNSISDESLSAEDEQGAALRQQILYNDYISKGFSEARAQREVEKSFKDGSDIADAKEALASLTRSFSDEYDELLEDAREAKRIIDKRNADYGRSLVDSVMKGEEFVGGLTLSAGEKKEVVRNLTKAVWQDMNTGRKYNAIDMYRQKNPVEFAKNVGLFFTLTDGFTKLDRLVGAKVEKKLKSSLKDLEGKLNTTRRTSDGNLEYMAGASAKRNGGALEEADWDIAI